MMYLRYSLVCFLFISLITDVKASLWKKKEMRSGANSMFADRIASRIGHQLEVIINDKGKFTYDLNTTISDELSISDGVTQWLFPPSASSFGTHNGKLPLTQMGGKDTVTGQWKIENNQKFEDYRFSAEVIDNFGDGYLLISAKRSITAGQETYYIRFLGKIRTDDITYDNTILSTQVSNVVFEILSEGQLSHGQQGGWLEQIYMRGLHPF